MVPVESFWDFPHSLIHLYRIYTNTCLVLKHALVAHTNVPNSMEDIFLYPYVGRLLDLTLCAFFNSQFPPPLPSHDVPGDTRVHARVPENYRPWEGCTTRNGKKLHNFSYNFSKLPDLMDIRDSRVRGCPDHHLCSAV